MGFIHKQSLKDIDKEKVIAIKSLMKFREAYSKNHSKLPSCDLIKLNSFQGPSTNVVIAISGFLS